MARPVLQPIHTGHGCFIPQPPASRVLRLSSASFLDGVITLDKGAPLYAIDSTHGVTTVSRCTPGAGLQRVAAVHWPSLEVTLHQAKLPASTFLRHSRAASLMSSCSSRKFRHAGNSFRWSSSTGTFECTAKDLRPVATYEPAMLTSRAKLRLYEPFASQTTLVDALLVSCILLVEQPPHQYSSSHQPLRRVTMEPTSPGVLKRHAVLADAFDDPPAQSDVKDRTIFITAEPSPSRLSLDTSTFLSTSSTSTATSPVSSSDAWSSRPWEQQPASRAWAAVAPAYKPKFDDDPSPIIGDEPDPIGPPPPYEEHEWTVRLRVPARHSTAKF